MLFINVISLWSFIGLHFPSFWQVTFLCSEKFLFSSYSLSEQGKAAWRICPFARKKHLGHHCSAETRYEINSPNIILN